MCRPNEIQYVLNPIPCGSQKRKQTVQAWLERFGISAEDTFFVKWNQAVLCLITVIQKVEEKPGVTPKTFEMLWHGIFMALYTDYDTQKDFYPQFEANVTKILCIFAELERYV